MRIQPNEQEVYKVLNNLGISWVRHEHPPVFSVAQAEKYWESIDGVHCKNLFLRNKKGNRHYLVVLEHLKKADIKKLERQLREDRLSFTSAERLKRYLGLEAGSVSPFGLVHDGKKDVHVVVDEDLRKADVVNFHPNVNTSTIGIKYSDFKKFLDWCGNTICYIQL